MNDSSSTTIPRPNGQTAISPTIENAARTPAHSQRSTSRLTEFVRRRLLDRLDHFDDGLIQFRDGDLSVNLGRKADNGLNAHLSVHAPAFYRHLATGGTLGFAESFFRQQWSTDDLTTLLRIFARNRTHLSGYDRGLSFLTRGFATLAHRLSSNTRRGSRRNIASHYDLSNDFFATFLDPTMMYSSALFEEPEMTLEQASIAKLEAVCRNLELRPHDRVVEIGTGWGGFAIHAARNYGCHVTTTTISTQQHEFAKRRIHDAGLCGHITLLEHDYRDLSGQYDKLVSVEMLEAVGHQFFDTYFATCNRLLKPGGRMVVQTITMPEQRYNAYLRSVDFIQKYIFPGGCLPSLAAIQQAVGRSTDLRLVDQSDFGVSYARTLAEWRGRFFARIDEVRRLGFDDRLVRMWEYYFCYCEAAFLERAVGVSQLVWVKA